ncbi:MAG: histidine kinase [Rikenellaceae bacterium]
MAPKNISRQIDLVFCLLLIPALMLLLPLDRWWESSSIFVVILLAWLYMTYWLHRTVTVPLMYGEKRRPTLALIIFIISLILTYYVSQYPMDFGHRMMPEGARRAMDLANDVVRERPQRPTSPPSSKMLEQAVWFLYVVVTTFSIVVALLSELNQQIIARQSIEFEKKKAELALYKAQINPHFLFNTLNTLLGLIITKSEEAEEAFMQFSNLMRYMCNNSTQDMVGIQTEIDYIEQYIEIQKYRLNEHTDIEFLHSGDSSSYECMIAPMLLITFVENAIKYGSSSHQRSKISINIKIENSILLLTASNPILPQTDSNKGAGIGIANCRKRLELLYPHKHTLLIGENSGVYDVSLTIKLS